MVCLLSVQYLFFGCYFLHVCAINCGPAYYKTRADECCPMCSPGLVVRRDCTSNSSTSCIPCVRGTYMNKANGLNKCFPCSPCDLGQGLFIQRDCTTTINTICDVRDGFHCKSYSSNSECSFAVEHTRCDPGQRTTEPGTKTSDTVCEVCPLGFYSQLGVNCTAWTDCVVIGQVKTAEGSTTQDVTCNNLSSRSHLILTAPILVTTLVVLLCFYRAREKPEGMTSPVQDTQQPDSIQLRGSLSRISGKPSASGHNVDSWQDSLTCTQVEVVDQQKTVDQESD
ncbi:hypothetical protein UPYG_G00004590 [Umbra pygmaea]|uniref:TNFR-Cys domain-containing protein n=1 Tax=Umbra pygmaea TaxID=75934 RepID=A0ABD0Y6B7_UMBPY